MAKQERRTFTAEQETDAARLILETRGLSDVMREIDIGDGSLRS